MFNIKDFKVGDRVKIVSEYFGDNIGREGVIEEINTDAGMVHIDVGDVDPQIMEATLRDDKIVKIRSNTPQHPKDKLIVYIQGTSVVAKYIREDKTSVEATAKCNPEDIFDFLIGAQVALKRLVNNLGKKEVISEAALGALTFEVTCLADENKLEVMK